MWQSFETIIEDLQHPQAVGVQSKVRFALEGGAAVRGPAVRGLKERCFHNHVEYDIDEAKSWLSSMYMVKLEGKSEDIVPILQWIRYIEQED